jgi:hypothetical protein
MKAPSSKTPGGSGACHCSEPCLSCKCNHSHMTTKQPEDYGQRILAAIQRNSDRQASPNQACKARTDSKAGIGRKQF